MSEQPNQERSIIPYQDSQHNQQRRTYPLFIVHPPRVLPPPILVPIQNEASSSNDQEHRHVQLMTLLDPLVQLFVCIQASAGRRIEASLHVPASRLRPGSLLFLPREVLLRASLRFIQNTPDSTQSSESENTPTSNTMEIATPTQIAQEELSRVLDVDGIYLLVAGNTSDELSEQQFQELLNRLAQLHQPQGPPPAASSAIEALPIVEVTQDMVQEGHKCTICCDEFECGRPNVVKLPCNHLFDKDCVESWLKQHNTCPVCRFALPTENEISATKTSPSPSVQDQPQPLEVVEQPNQNAVNTQSTNTTEPSTTVADSQPMEMDIPTSETSSTTLEQPEPEIVATVPSQKEKKISGLKRGFFNQKRSNSKQPKTQPTEEPFLQGIKRGFFNQSTQQ